MPQPRSVLASLVVIAAVVGGTAAAFAYTAGWLTPGRLTPEKLVDVLAPPGGPAAGHRLNHAKGICFTGTFEANGNGAALSKAGVFAAGRPSPVVGRFSIASADLHVEDPKARVRGMALSIRPPGGGEWRTAMIDAPFFAVASPQAFYALQTASRSKDPDAMKAFAAAHPEIANFGAWAKSAPFTGSFAEERYNSLDAFLFVDNAGAGHPVRWSLLPAAQVETVSADDLAKRGPDVLEKDIATRVAAGPQRWTMLVTLANAGDPTADPSKAWPDDRKSLDVGTLTIAKIEPEPDGPCRDLVFDPTVLPDGILTSDDPFPAARSAAYAVSYDRRSAEDKDYPRTAATGAQP